MPKTGNLHENADFWPVGADRGERPASVMGALGLEGLDISPSKYHVCPYPYVACKSQKSWVTTLDMLALSQV